MQDLLTKGVAGVHAPAFVEREWKQMQDLLTKGVAGVHAPAFVERSPTVSLSGVLR